MAWTLWSEEALAGMQVKGSALIVPKRSSSGLHSLRAAEPRPRPGAYRTMVASFLNQQLCALFSLVCEEHVRFSPQRLAVYKGALIEAAQLVSAFNHVQSDPYIPAVLKIDQFDPKSSAFDYCHYWSLVVQVVVARGPANKSIP